MIEVVVDQDESKMFDVNIYDEEDSTLAKTPPSPAPQPTSQKPVFSAF